MVKREHSAIGLTADEHDVEPVAKRAGVEEPDHLLCPITREMFRDAVFLVGSGHTYERKAIERHLRSSQIDPKSNIPVRSKQLITNWSMRNGVGAWLNENPGVTPDGWTSRDMPPPQLSMEYHRPDLEVLRKWRESCPELRDLWRGDDAGHWQGVTWSSDGRVTGLHISLKAVSSSQLPLSGQLPRLEGLTFLKHVNLNFNQLTGPIPEKLFRGLTSLEEVRLFENQLTGPIPEKLFEGLCSLRTVDLGNNHDLTGPVPEKLFQGLTSLEHVYLFGNQLSGPIPEKLFQGLTSLQTVILSSNKLSGPIPEKLFKGLTSLETVWVSNNQLSGPIPERLREVGVKL